MALRTLSMIATMVAAVSSAVLKKRRLNLEDPGSTPIKECPLFPDVIGVILSFLAPFEWNDLFSVNRLFHASKAIAIANLKQARAHFDYSPNLDIGDALERVMEQPGWKGVIANERDYLIIDYPSKEEKKAMMMPYSGKVRITGVQDKVSWERDQSHCADLFVHRTHEFGNWAYVRNVDTGREIKIDEDLGENGQTVLVNEEQIVCVSPKWFSVYQLNWQKKKSSVICRKPLISTRVSKHIVSCDESNVYSVISSGDFSKRIRKYNWKTKTSSWIGQPYPFFSRPQLSSDHKWILTVDMIESQSMRIESINGRKRCLCIPYQTHSFFDPSPDGRYVIFEIKLKLVLQNLHSGKVTVIADEDSHSVGWLTDSLFLVSSPEHNILRSVLNPCVDLDSIPANKLFGDQSVVDSLTCSAVGSVLDFKEIMNYVLRIGENMFFIGRKRMIIKVEWVESDEQ